MSKEFNDLIRQFNGLTSALTPLWGFEEPQVKTSVPVDRYYDKESGAWVIEMAVVGKTKDDVKISTYVKNGKTHLKLEAGTKPVEGDETDSSRDESDSSCDESNKDSREYIVRKIKQGYLMVDYTINDSMDLTKTTAKVQNGLLTVTIPKKEKVIDEVTITVE